MRIILLFTFSLALLFQTGCNTESDRPADMPRLYPVTITVTGDGQPREEILVNLIAKTPAKYGAASGTTDASGDAKILTYGFVGVPLGEYTVTLSRIDIEGMTRVENSGGWDEFGGQVYQYVEDKYTKAESTPYSITVTEKGVKETFEIGAPVRTFVRNN